MSKLQVYKASAGSGKTFTLAKEYLKHLFANPTVYRNILAVTFTNKATAEMKNRIITELSRLAEGSESAYIRSDDPDIKLTPQQIQSRAQYILNLLLHDYSRFSVQTIDKFFQQVIHSFSREMGIQTGFNLELDDEKVLNEIIDTIWVGLEKNESLKNWLVRFAESKIEEAKSWNIRHDILQLGKEVFKEHFKRFDTQLIKKLDNKDFLQEYLGNLNQIRSQFMNTLKNYGKQGLDLMEKHSLEIADFYYGTTGFANHFKKLYEQNISDPSNRTREAMNNPEKWYKQDSGKISQIIKAYEDGMNETLCQAVFYYDSNKIDYNTADCILSLIYTLGILTDLSKKIKEYSFQKNVFLISDAAVLIQKIIDGNETPFIYEKIGYVFKKYMIDEFQDTSQVQWDNFKPLISNSLSEDQDCLVVGDVKQSIYRWRNSDWKILSDRLKKDFEVQGIEIRNLGYNWRSRKNIVDFNNTLFFHATKIVEDQFWSSVPEEYKTVDEISDLRTKISDSYSGLIQQLPQKEKVSGGSVQVTFFEEEKNGWREQVNQEIPVLIEELQDKGIQLGEIAILVRSKKDGREIVETLLKHKNKQQTPYRYNYDVISNESLYLKSSSAVNFIISLLKYIISHEDKINLVFLLSEYNFYLKKEPEVENKLFDLCFSEDKKTTEKLKEFLYHTFPEDLKTFKNLPLYELTEKIILLFGLNRIKDEVPYLQAFQDIVVEYTRKETSDITSFMEWWEKEGQQKTLAVSGQQNAIRVLTIHKAKGLEFRVVIIPYCNWTIDHSPSPPQIIWCRPYKKPFSNLDLVPLKYYSRLSGTIFYKDYYYEKIHAYVDNLNLLYVAFTRAAGELYVFAPEPKRNNLKTVADLLYSTFTENLTAAGSQPSEVRSLIEFDQYWNPEKKQLSIGGGQIEPSEPGLTTAEMKLTEYSTWPVESRLRLSLKSPEYFLLEEKNKQQKINYGKIMHEVFQFIYTKNDIDKAIKKLTIEGKIATDEVVTVKNRVLKALQNPRAEKWFNGDWEVKTEADILLKKGKTRRPDRVLIREKHTIVIDYKFGDIEKQSYLTQIREYMKYLRLMGFDPVEGYIWYIEQDKIITA